MQYFIGIDVGTGSARAGVFDQTGAMLGSASKPIQMWKPQHDFVEQSSDDIWESCCFSVRAALAQAGLRGEQIAGVGFDATCSLVALDAEDRPVSISPSGSDAQNVIVWMDHRAVSQTERINQTQHAVLRYVGGTMSPEMQPPKLLWLQENLPATWQRTARFLDLPDFLTYRATGSDTRSLCTTVCKWTFQGHENCWDDSFWREIGLGEFADENYRRIGQQIRPLGEAIGNGLTAKAAEELGLAPGTPVAVAAIDAHAGGIGVLAAAEQNESVSFQTRVALVGGTS